MSRPSPYQVLTDLINDSHEVNRLKSRVAEIETLNTTRCEQLAELVPVGTSKWVRLETSRYATTLVNLINDIEDGFRVVVEETESAVLLDWLNPKADMVGAEALSLIDDVA